MTEQHIPDGYAPLTEVGVREALSGLDAVRAILGADAAGAGRWRVSEVGDGNLNMVFVVAGAHGGVVVKQALPYLRLVGESWPLSLSRAHYEAMALRRHHELAPGRVPRVYHFDETLAMIVMEYLHPHIIMRRGMIAGEHYPKFVGHITDFMASTLFHTSDLCMRAADKKRLVADFCGNTDLCKITEDLIFTDPYRIAPDNRWTSPQLDDIARAFREDDDLKIAISRLKLKFMSSTEALIHGDLHTGSMMVTEDDTRVIDPEFAFAGPMGFDIGAVLANLLLNYFSQDGHEKTPGERDAYRAWVLDAVAGVWNEFRRKFMRLWEERGDGDAYPRVLFEDASGRRRLRMERERYMNRLLQDALGFCAAKMIRRILGIAHNIDLEWIADPATRAACERRALLLARNLMVNTDSYRRIESVTDAARLARDDAAD